MFAVLVADSKKLATINKKLLARAPTWPTPSQIIKDAAPLIQHSIDPAHARGELITDISYPPLALHARTHFAKVNSEGISFNVYLPSEELRPDDWLSCSN